MSNYKQYTGNLIFEGLTANSVVSFSGNSSILINGDLEVLGNTTLSGNITASTGNLDISGTAIAIASGASETSISIVPGGPVSSQAFIDVPDNATANTDNVRIYNNLGNVEISTDSGNNVWLFDSSGFVYGPGRFRDTATDNGLTLDGGADDVYLFTAGEGPVRIVANSDGETSREWTFSQDGSLTAPGDITVGGDVTGTAGASTLILKAQPDSNTAIQLNNTVDSAIRTVANLEIRTDVSNTAQVWNFDTAGDLTAPGNITTTANIVGNNINASVSFGLPVYADATARDAEITSPTAGMMIYVTDSGMQVRGATSWNTIAGSGT